MGLNQTQISSSLGIQNVCMFDIFNRDYLSGSWAGADYNLCFTNELYNKTLDEHFSIISSIYSYYDSDSLTIFNSNDSLYLSHVNYFKSNFLCKDNSDFKAFHSLVYVSDFIGYHHTYFFDFFNMFDFETIKKISFGGRNFKNSGNSGLSDDSKINYFNGSLIEQIFTGTTLYRIREDGFWLPASCSLFKYSDRWLFVVPTAFSVDWSTWNYSIDADVYEVKILPKKCCLAQCFGIIE